MSRLLGSPFCCYIPAVVMCGVAEDIERKPRVTEVCSWKKEDFMDPRRESKVCLCFIIKISYWPKKKEVKKAFQGLNLSL